MTHKPPAEPDMTHKFATLAIHAGQPPDPTTGAVDHADLCDVHLRATESRRPQGPRLRALAQSDALGVRALRRGARIGNRRVRLRLRHGDDRDGARAARQRRARRCARRSVRRHAPAVRARPAEERGSVFHVPPVCAQRRASGRGAAGHADDLDRIAVESAAQAGRPRGRRLIRAGTQHPVGHRQYVRVAVVSAPARARLRHRRAFGDQVSERTLGRHRRRVRHVVQGDRREARGSCRTPSGRYRVRSMPSSSREGSRRSRCGWNATARTRWRSPSGCRGIRRSSR